MRLSSWTTSGGVSALLLLRCLAYVSLRGSSNLKAAGKLGMETIRAFSFWRHSEALLTDENRSDVPIGGTLDAVKKLEAKLGIDLTTPLLETAKL